MLAIFLKDKVVQGLSDKIPSYSTSLHFIIWSPDGCDYSQSGKSILMKIWGFKIACDMNSLLIEAINFFFILFNDKFSREL